ncbi:hypothetical protein KIW84_065876 [Lathyrus oleraceus]|uniref:Uncharacterized protein n=1 Tax=Pisum sativum TaxID=3888 RepID=A0A9D4WID1_PEA|nr:hypothetical protein KIW84_065876 [Pisum sativum]
MDVIIIGEVGKHIVIEEDFEGPTSDFVKDYDVSSIHSSESDTSNDDDSENECRAQSVVRDDVMEKLTIAGKHIMIEQDFEGLTSDFVKDYDVSSIPGSESDTDDDDDSENVCRARSIRCGKYG